MRLLYGDTETTGLHVKAGDRLVEIGFKEYVDFRPTGRVYHQYVNPQRDMPEGAFNVHGLSSEFLSAFPPFTAIVDAMLDFVRGAEVVFHNAEFDIGFLSHQVTDAKRKPSWQAVHDTLHMANKRFPRQPNSLDALASRFKVTGFDRSRHGTMVDIDILAEVHAHLCGKRTLALEAPTPKDAGRSDNDPMERVVGTARDGVVVKVDEEARAVHRAYVAQRLPKGAWASAYAAEETATRDAAGPGQAA